RHIVTEVGKRDGGRGGERNALVSRPEDHVEADPGGERRLRVMAGKLAQLAPVVEEPGVEEVRRQAPGLGLELPEAKDPGADGELDELAAERVASWIARGGGGGFHARHFIPRGFCRFRGRGGSPGDLPRPGSSRWSSAKLLLLAFRMMSSARVRPQGD